MPSGENKLITLSHWRQIYDQWVANDEFDGWTEEQIGIFLNIISRNVLEERLMNLKTGDRFSECFHQS